MKCIKAIHAKVVNGAFVPNVVRCDNDMTDYVLATCYWNYTAKKVWKTHGRKYLGRKEK